MASLILGTAGAVIGGVISEGNPYAIQAGFLIGSSLGNAYQMRHSLPRTEGPRLGDRVVQSSTYGALITRNYGTVRIAGNMIWSTDILETRHEQSQSGAGGGGKGGGGQQQSSVSYTYSASFAIGLCAGPMIGFRRMWADSKLIYEIGTLDADGHPDGYTAGPLTNVADVAEVRFYPGDETQTADPLIVATEGANTPAFRGLCYIVLDTMELANYGNRIPNISVE